MLWLEFNSLATNHSRTTKAPLLRLCVVACLAACDGTDTSTGPDGVAAAPTATAGVLRGGTAVEVVSGETGGGIEGAVFTVNGHDYTSAEGRVTLSEAVSLQSEVRIVAPGMLERRTILRNLAETRFSLWPHTSATGMDEGFTRAVVYSHANGAGPLRRLKRGTTRVVVVPSRDLRGAAEMTAHQEAAERVTEASGGQVAYVVATERPVAGVYVETRLGRDDDELCRRDNILAFEQDFIRSGETVRSVIVFCDPRSARTAVVSHEMGHSFGLYHSPDAKELMYAFFDGHGAIEFSARESLAMRLMLQRPGGNQFPDDDRSVSLTGASGTHVTICPGSGGEGRSAPLEPTSR